jgi:hypothetical protein
MTVMGTKQTLVFSRKRTFKVVPKQLPSAKIYRSGALTNQGVRQELGSFLFFDGDFRDCPLQLFSLSHREATMAPAGFIRNALTPP